MSSLEGDNAFDPAVWFFNSFLACSCRIHQSRAFMYFPLEVLSMTTEVELRLYI